MLQMQVYMNILYWGYSSVQGEVYIVANFNTL